jgi:DNA-binding CsgD family transcriptional regulator
LVFAAIFIPLALLGQQNTGISAFFASIGIYSIEMISWILLSNMASTSRFPRFLVFAASYLIFHVGMAAGILVGIALSDHMLSFSVLSICALVALAGFAFTDSDTTVHFDPPNQSELGGIATKSGLVEKTVGLIAQDFGLSKREQEVLMMWATGYPVKMIEEKLFVSASTVKTHIQHIYEKCDAHNRVEVIALLEEYSVKVQERLDQT